MLTFSKNSKKDWFPLLQLTRNMKQKRKKKEKNMKSKSAISLIQAKIQWNQQGMFHGTTKFRADLCQKIKIKKKQKKQK